jgi:hypothetical protein
MRKAKKRGRGRPPKPKGEKRSDTIDVLLTPGEGRVIDQEAAESGQTRSEYVITVLRQHIAMGRHRDITTLVAAFDLLDRATALAGKYAVQIDQLENENAILLRHCSRFPERLADAEFTASLRKRLRLAPGPDAGRLSDEEAKDGTAKTPA